VTGRKRHLVVDTEGFVLKAFVTEANYQDGTVASWLVEWLAQHCPRLVKIWADRAYRGRFVDEAEARGIDVEIVVPDPGQKGFQVQPRRWVVERTFAWLSNYRRLSKDFEQWMQTSDAAIYAAMSHLMVRRLARLRAAK
jgi:putative transposase